MKQLFPSKKNKMKTDDPMMTAGVGRRYITAVLAASLLSGLLLNTAEIYQTGTRERTTEDRRYRLTEITL
jgi:hypothetical protein